MLNKLKESDKHMNFPISNKTKLKQFKCQMTYLCIYSCEIINLKS